MQVELDDEPPARTLGLLDARRNVARDELCADGEARRVVARVLHNERATDPVGLPHAPDNDVIGHRSPRSIATCSKNGTTSSRRTAVRTFSRTNPSASGQP